MNLELTDPLANPGTNLARAGTPRDGAVFNKCSTVVRRTLVLSPTSMPWSVVTVVPTSTRAQPAVFRPEAEVMGSSTRFRVDQIRTVDVCFIRGDPVDYLERDELTEIEHAVTRYLGL